MNDTLSYYLKNLLYHRPEAKTPVIAIYRGFLASLPERDRRLWPRWAFLRGLEQAGILCGRDSSGTLCAAGVSLDPPPRWVRTEAGRLVRV